MEFITRHKTVVTFVVFTLFCIVSLSVRTSTFTLTVEGVFSAMVMPFQKAYNGIQNGVSRMFKGFSELGEATQELEKARKQLKKFESIDEKMRVLTEQLDETSAENEKLRATLGMKERLEYDTIAAMIISKDPDNWFRTILVNRGSNDGVKVNMPVVAYQGDQKAVVGKVMEVRGSVSRIAPVISPDVRIGVKLRDSGFPGLVYGHPGNPRFCKMDYLSRAAQVRPGDVVVTSGQGGVFPAGLMVGKVITSGLLESSPYQRAIIQPTINYNLVEQVFIIKKDTDKDLLEFFKVQE